MTMTSEKKINKSFPSYPNYIARPSRDVEEVPGARPSSRAAHRAPTTSLLGPVVLPIVEDILNPEVDDEGPKSKVLGNTRLTSLLGLIIFIELAVIGITVPAIGQLFTLHAIVGYLLIVPIVFKLVSTGYRFFRYYFKNEKYAKAGPPRIVLRLAAPVLVLSTIILMVSGVVLMIIGPTGNAEPLWKTIHQASFVVWFVVTALHVVSYISKATYQGGAELGLKRFGPIRFSRKRPSYRLVRLSLVVVVMLLSVVTLITQYHYIAPWTNYFQG